MTCTKHPTRLVVEETGFCFGCYEDARNAKYAALTAEIERLALRGVTLAETWPNGNMTAWRFVNTGNPSTARITAETLVGIGTSGEHDAFVLGLTPAYLAEHLTNRSRGFGTTVQAFCFDCGDNLIDLPTTDDPACPVCAARHEALGV